MQLVKMILFEQVSPLWRHVLLLWPMTTLPAIAVVILVQNVVVALGVELAQRGPDAFNPWVSAFLSIIVAPIGETLFLSAWIGVSKLFGLRNLFIAVTSGVIAGLLHAIVSPTWFFPSAWAFFVFASAYLAWRPSSFFSAFAAAALPHALNNATGVAMQTMP